MSLIWKDESSFYFSHTNGTIQEISSEENCNTEECSRLKKGDKIYSINGTRITEEDDIYQLLEVESQKNESSVVKLGLFRRARFDKDQCKS